MKLAKDIKVGDIPYSYRLSEGFSSLPSITFIEEPIDDRKYYVFNCGRKEECRFSMMPTNSFGRMIADFNYVVVPESKTEIDTLNNMLSEEYRNAQKHIKEQLCDFLSR